MEFQIKYLQIDFKVEKLSQFENDVKETFKINYGGRRNQCQVHHEMIQSVSTHSVL